MCVGACPYAALVMRGSVAGSTAACTLCGLCVEACPVGAIRLQEEAETGARGVADLSAWRGVWVFAEQVDGVVQPVTFELIGEGRRLAEARGTSLHAVLLGDGLDRAARNLLEYPLASVLQVEAPVLGTYAAEPYARVLAELIRMRRPEIVLAGATAIGRAFLGRTAVLARTGLTADCTELSITADGSLLQTRPAFGGNVMASILCRNHRPQMATVRHKVFPEAVPDPDRVDTPGADGAGRIERIVPDPAWLRTRTERVAFEPDAGGGAPLHEADLVLAGGRGMGGRAGFALLEEAARALGGAVAASRSAVDAGWYPYSHQVGQTGKTVAPKLYLACGISGAVQHQVGMRGAETIVAINADPEAPIFDMATYGLVGDVFTLLPAVLEAVAAYRARKG